jgi:phosphoribosylformylglycinamidine synthase subunit PurL
VSELPLHRALGMTDEEYAAACEKLGGREPNRTELAMYSVMWSEHCSYKSSKVHLRKLPTEGPQVLVGPGADAGVVDIGDGQAVSFKIESHSHPSAIEPYQGAATGVGGIVRDIISMGARPIALLDPLRFGPLDDARNRWIFTGVVAGIGGYGNCIGVPTVGGEIAFAEPHSANPSINVMCVGLLDADRIMPSAAEGEGNLVLLFGASTGRDGIGGVSVLASATLEDGGGDNRPSVQIGDPFTEKLLIEASLELIERDLLVGLQDLGGAGLCCATSETASRAGTGLDINLDVVPLREQGLEPFEILTSESQERMLAIVSPEKLDEAVAVVERWGLHAALIGTVTDSGNVVATSNGETVADVPARSLADEGPIYDRPMEPMPAPPAAGDPRKAGVEPKEALLALLASPNIASKHWVYEQYDSIVQGGTIAGCGDNDAALVRVPGTTKALALSSDGRGRYGALDPYLGAAHAVAESARNVACTGAKPLAITNCMNFGNPERPQVMWQFSESVRGMGDACLAFDTPVTGGNVSFYNESGDSAIWPTPVIGMLGLIADYHRAVPSGFAAEGHQIWILGDTAEEFGGSEFQALFMDELAGQPPALDLGAEAALHGLLRALSAEDVASSAHDCSDGGLAVALVESALSGVTGFDVDLGVLGLDAVVALFSETASRVVVGVQSGDAERLRELAERYRVPLTFLGRTKDGAARFRGLFDLDLAEASAVYEGAIPALLSGGAG